MIKRPRARLRLWRTRAYAFRLPDELMVRLDAHVDRLKAALPGVEVSRTTAVRSLLTSALDSAERVGADGTAQTRR